ncbi:hypothetical protein FWJ33_04125 [Leptospira interrogans serovar Hardjo]|nr:hypothetical protein B0191_12215 [Leptospira interrogans serovar Hardjo]QEH98719.1 hypothetical protein FWJ33_04125 [Leptospira interrogans serovar Hardjo]
MITEYKILLSKFGDPIFTSFYIINVVNFKINSSLKQNFVHCYIVLNDNILPNYPPKDIKFNGFFVTNYLQ